MEYVGLKQLDLEARNDCVSEIKIEIKKNKKMNFYLSINMNMNF